MARVTLSEAAKRLGLSKQGVLNRIKSGKLEGQQVDGRWLILVDDVDTSDEENRQSVDGDVARLQAEIARLQHDNACLQAKVDGMEAVLTAFSSGELIGKLTELTATLAAQQPPKALQDTASTQGTDQGEKRRRFRIWPW